MAAAAVATNPANATNAFSLGGPAGGDYGYAYKPGGVDYFRSGTPITNAQFDSAQTINGSGPRSAAIEANVPAVLGDSVGPANSNGPAAAPAYADKSGDISMQNAGLGSVDSGTGTGLAAIDKALSGITSSYNTEAANANSAYGTNSTQNQNNLQQAKHTALTNAAQGRQGLFGTLASLGALNGSGIDLANTAVQRGANEDLSTAGNTYATNQSGLDAAIKTFKDQDTARRTDAATAAADAKTKLQGDAAKTKQQYYTNLANDYTAQGDKANAAKFTSLANSLFPAIAGANIPSTNLAPEVASYTAPDLGTYLSSANNTAVQTTPSPTAGGTPGLIANPVKRLQAA